MNATRILPDLQASLLCEEVRQEANGNLFLIGVINFIRVPQLPVVAGRLCVFNRWTAGLGQFTENIRLIAPDQTTVLRKGEMKFELRDPALHATNVMVFGNVEFKTAGNLLRRGDGGRRDEAALSRAGHPRAAAGARIRKSRRRKRRPDFFECSGSAGFPSGRWN